MAFFDRPFFKGLHIIHAQKFSPFHSPHACPWIVRPLFNDLDKNVNYHAHSRKWHFGEIFLLELLKKWRNGKGFFPFKLLAFILHTYTYVMFKSCFKFQTRLLPLTVNAMHQPRQTNSFYHQPHTTSTVLPSR